MDMAESLNYFRKYAYASAYRYCNCYPGIWPDDVDDVAQFGLIEVWRQLTKEPDLPPELVVWRMRRQLRRLSKRPYRQMESLDRAFKHDRMTQFDSEEDSKELPDPQPSPEVLADLREQLAYIFSYRGFTGKVAELTAQGYTADEVGTKLHLSEINTYRYRNQARKFLKRAFKEV